MPDKGASKKFLSRLGQFLISIKLLTFNTRETDRGPTNRTERQEVIRYLEADKPLPDKYRFLLFGDKREVELVWNGKTNEVCNTVLPFQIIEQIDEPRLEHPSDKGMELFDTRGRQKSGWTNKLIWGDNKLILSSLKNGPMREEIEAQGGIKLIYIDPPFDVGADFSMDIEIGEDTSPNNPTCWKNCLSRYLGQRAQTAS